MKPIKFFHRFFIAVALCFCLGQLQAQINKAEYFFDTDPGFGNATAITVTPGTDVNLPFTPSIASLSDGLHRLYVRVQDAAGNWSLTSQQLFYREAVVNNPLVNIVQSEYFIDNDPGFGNAINIPLTPGTDISFSFTPSVTTISAGLHRLFVRTKDASGKWSLTTQQLFYLEPVVSNPLVNITKAEFFFDTDPGFGNASNITITPGTDITHNFNSDISALSNGLHRLFVRTQDASGRWSLTAQQLFYKEAVVNNPLVNVVQAEYFFDTDPGFGNATQTAVAAGQDIVINFSGNISSLSNGLHRLFVRTKDANGHWSVTTQQLFYKDPLVASTLSGLVTLEYFWNTDPGFGNGTLVTLPANSGELTDFVFPVNTPASLSGARRNLFIRVVDATDWSLTLVRTVDFTNIPLPVTLLEFSARAAQEKVALKWTTTNEINNKHFEVERSIDGVNFDKLGTVGARGTGNVQTTYDFVDERPVQGMNYYRLKQVDLDGKFTYSPIVPIRFDKASHLVRVYPNPATSFFVVQSDKRFVRVELTDMSGKIVQQWNVQPNNQYRFNSLSKGMYVIRLVEADRNLITKAILIDK